MARQSSPGQYMKPLAKSRIGEVRGIFHLDESNDDTLKGSQDESSRVPVHESRTVQTGVSLGETDTPATSSSAVGDDADRRPSQTSNPKVAGNDGSDTSSKKKQKAQKKISVIHATVTQGSLEALKHDRKTSRATYAELVGQAIDALNQEDFKGRMVGTEIRTSIPRSPSSGRPGLSRTGDKDLVVRVTSEQKEWLEKKRIRFGSPPMYQLAGVAIDLYYSKKSNTARREE